MSEWVSECVSELGFRFGVPSRFPLRLPFEVPSRVPLKIPSRGFLLFRVLLIVLVAKWMHFTLFGIILPTIKLKVYTCWGL